VSWQDYELLHGDGVKSPTLEKFVW